MVPILTTKRSGQRSNTSLPPAVGRILTDGWRPRSLAVLFVLLGALLPQNGLALDIFTLWRQPEIPLQIVAGSHVDYSNISLAGGRRVHDLIRIQCLYVDADDAAVAAAGSEIDRWAIELVPLVEDEHGAFTPVAGEGLWLQVTAKLLEREGTLVDSVERVVRWHDGQAIELEADEWRDDPLVTVSFASEFIPDQVTRHGSSSRVVSGRSFVCDQFVLAAADTQAVDLPHGRLEQITTHEISVAFHEDIPFLGIAFATERNVAVSQLDPPSSRFDPPPPTNQIDTMELIGFGFDAIPLLGSH